MLNVRSNDIIPYKRKTQDRIYENALQQISLLVANKFTTNSL